MTALTDKQLLYEWLLEAQVKEGLQCCAADTLAAIDANLSLRIPRTEQERRNAFTGWLNGYRAKIGLEMQKQFAIQFPDISNHLDKSVIKETVDEDVWPLIEGDVRQRFETKFIPYAVLSQAIAWGRKNIGDTARYGQPQRDGCAWRVMLGLTGYGDDLGQITLDADGNILLEQTTTRQELLKYIHDHPSVPAATVNA